MAKLVILKIDGGNFQDGFKVTLRIGDEGEPLSTEISGNLPPNPTLPENYQRWQSDFLDLDSKLLLPPNSTMPKKISRWLSNFFKLDRRPRARKGSSRVIDPQKNFEQCQQSAQDFINNFKNWLSSSQDSALQNLREKLCQKLGDEKEAIRVIIQTDDAVLKKLPWHEWDLFADTYTQAEVALWCSSEYEKPTVVQTTDKTAVRILAILGNSEGINIESDRKSLENLMIKGAKPTFLVEPKRAEVSDNLWDQNWDILFFAGHSSSQNETGRIYINRSPNPKENCLTITQLKFGLRKAINHGLQLAIFNSCDGLKLAIDLAELNIPQVIVMREPVPNRVAQTFLQFFLNAFTGGESLYVAVRNARERLRENGLDDKFPGACWLPVIYQNPTVKPPSYHDFLSNNRHRELEELKELSSTEVIEIINHLESLVERKLVTWDIIRQAYNVSIPKWHDSPTFSKNEAQNCLEAIYSIAVLPQKKENPPLAKFSSYIAKALSDSTEQVLLNNLISKYFSLSCPSKNSEPEKASSCDLWVVVSTDRTHPNCYSVTIHLDKKILSENEFIEAKEFRTVLQDTLKKAYSELMSHLDIKGLCAEHVWIRFVLPRLLLSEAVDQYKLEGYFGTLGTKFKIIVSSLERAKFPEYSVLVRDCWMKYQDRMANEVRCTDDINSLEESDTYIPAFIVNNSDNSKYDPENLCVKIEEKVVMAMLPFPPKMTASLGDKTDYLNALLQAGVPVILWTRNTESNFIPNNMENCICCKQKLTELPKRVYKERQAAYGSEDSSHIGNHLTLLWDDPTFRLDGQTPFAPIAKR
jgi:hypothetical protein